MEEGRNFPNLAVFTAYQLGGRIFFPVNNLVNIFLDFLSFSESACKMPPGAVFAALAGILKSLPARYFCTFLPTR